MSQPPFHLRSLNAGVRLGLTFLCFVILGGYAASLRHLYLHDNKRDERPGLTVDDVKGVYHGIRSKSPILAALERGHPESLKQPERDGLIKWLTGKDVTKVFDDIDLGDKAPEAIIAANCRSCHAKTAKDPIGRTVPLETPDEVFKLAASRDISPNSVEIVTASTHVHALSLGSLGALLVLMAACTRWPRMLTGLLATACGAGLLADIGGWWLTRHHADFAYMVIAGGGAFAGSSVILLLLILADLWLPKRD
ncbi:MAG: hypothetical protein JSR77_06740 [Planctomycetes bacterium]|nr:hypothetical protein [Planctomycetota bacterium]